MTENKGQEANQPKSFNCSRCHRKGLTEADFDRKKNGEFYKICKNDQQQLQQYPKRKVAKAELQQPQPAPLVVQPVAPAQVVATVTQAVAPVAQLQPTIKQEPKIFDEIKKEKPKPAKKKLEKKEQPREQKEQPKLESKPGQEDRQPIILTGLLGSCVRL